MPPIFIRLIVAVACVSVIAACGGSDDATTATVAPTAGDAPTIGEVVELPVPSAEHVVEPVDYQHRPPTGGDHFPVWATCGFYTVEVPEVTAVHTLEHGAVWFTYRSDVTESDLTTLRDLAAGNDKILVSPYPDQAAPLVASAWGRQVHLERFDDTAAQFVADFVGADSSPEPDVTCQEGIGTAPDNIDTLVDGSVFEVPR